MNLKPQRIALAFVDALLLAIAWVLSYVVVFLDRGGIPGSESTIGEDYFLQMKLLLPWVVLTHVGLFAAFQLYRGILRYAGTTELRAILGAGALQGIAWGAFSLYLEGQTQFFDLPQRQLADGSYQVIRVSFTILLIYLALGTFLTGGLRLSRRFLMEATVRVEGSEAPATLIVGAGDVADSVLRNLARGAMTDLRPVAAVTAKESRVGLRLHGVPVVATLDRIADVLKEYDIHRVLIALDEPTPEVLRGVVAACDRAEVQFRIVPSLRDIAGGKVSVSQTREIQIEDLLGREPVDLDLPAERNYLRGQTVLVTGAGGSIGSELSRQAARSGAGTLLLLGKGENSIFQIAAELARSHPDVRTVAIIADIRDSARLRKIFAQHRPTIVFHAAAHKHVPLMEEAPEEAIKNNVIGTWNVAQMAEHFGAERFVMISSDKAVAPSSMMGATKRFAEMVIFALAAQSRCVFQAVRFGNVLGSRGSVIPTFQEQIRNGGPVTVTHPDITRYFMTIPEAVNLVLQAGSRGQNGALYVLDMGQPVRIADLARNMIVLCGYRPDVDIRIEYVGLRPGEKLTESLMTEFEEASATEIPKLSLARARHHLSLGEIETAIEAFARLAHRGDVEGIYAVLQRIIPDYHPQNRPELAPEFVREQLATQLSPAHDQTAMMAGFEKLEAEAHAIITEDAVADPDEIRQPAEEENGTAAQEPSPVATPEPGEAPTSAEEPPAPEPAPAAEPEEAPVPAAEQAPETPAEPVMEADEPVIEAVPEPVAEPPAESPLPALTSDVPEVETVPPAAPEPAAELPEATALSAEPEDEVLPDPVPEAAGNPFAEPERSFAPFEEDEAEGSPMEETVTEVASAEEPAPAPLMTAFEEPETVKPSSDEPTADEPYGPAVPGQQSAPNPIHHQDLGPEEELAPDLAAHQADVAGREELEAPTVLPSAPPSDPTVEKPSTPPESGPQSVAAPGEEEFLPGGELSPDKETEEIMTASASENGPTACLLLRVSKGSDAETLKLLVKQLQDNVLSPGDSLVVAGPADMAKDLGVPTLLTGTKPEGAITQEALDLNPDAGMLVTLSSDTLITAETLRLFREAIGAKGVMLAYSNYREDRDGVLSDVKLHDHEGCPHERFEYGPVIGYCTNAIRSVGGVRRDLDAAWEYDLHLKLMEKGEFRRIQEFSYTRFIPVTVDDKGKKVFSPGMGPLGGFSYVFYPADVEKEVTEVWEQALHRRGAWIDHPFATVNHGDRKYEVMATVVIPILNRVKFIGNAIEKVLSGTYQNFEIVLVDNGSTDGTVEKVQEYAARDNRIRLIHGKGGSIASALNEGIRAARGKYICQLDSDDEYAPDTIEQVVTHLESHPQCGLAITYYRLMDEHGKVIEDIAPITHSGYSRNQVIRRDGAGATRVFPKVVLEEFGLYDEEHYGNFGEDYDMVLKVGEKYSVDRVHKVLYHYRRHSDNTDVTRDPAMKYKNKNRSRQEALRRRKEINKALGKA